jgi:hypothetical protein
MIVVHHLNLEDPHQYQHHQSLVSAPARLVVEERKRRSTSHRPN